MSAGDLPQLADEQLASFDTEYVTDKLWEPVRRCIDRDYPDGHFTFLDVGGGIGVFADRILDGYPHATGVVLDNSQLLLNRNQLNPRKTLVLDSVEHLPDIFDQKFDIVFANWILHHLVSSSYTRTRSNISDALVTMSGLVAENGHISVYENLYNGLVVDAAPSWIIYRLTSSRSITRLSRRHGANTAGVGVCFLSQAQWRKVFDRAELDIVESTPGERWSVPFMRKAVLHVGNVRCGHFWLEPRPGSLSGRDLDAVSDSVTAT